MAAYHAGISGRIPRDVGRTVELRDDRPGAHPHARFDMIFGWRTEERRTGQASGNLAWPAEEIPYLVARKRNGERLAQRRLRRAGGPLKCVLRRDLRFDRGTALDCRADTFRDARLARDGACVTGTRGPDRDSRILRRRPSLRFAVGEHALDCAHDTRIAG